MRNPLDRFPRTPDGDIDETSIEWIQFQQRCIELAEEEDELCPDDEPYIESFVQTRWRHLDPIDQAQHALSGSELFKQKNMFEQFLKDNG
jgi:hypothetical protein